MKINLLMWKSGLRLIQTAQAVASHARQEKGRPRVVFFNATARLSGLSQNSAFALLTAWGLRLSGFEVHHFVCHAGLAPCVLGTNRQDYYQAPPCRACIRQSRQQYWGADVHWLKPPDSARRSEWNTVEYNHLVQALSPLDVPSLATFEFAATEHLGHKTATTVTPAVPLGQLVLPSIRWALRRYTLPDDEATRYLMRQYMLSTYHLIQEFNAFIDRNQPAVAIIFNGIMYPEAAARWAAQQRSLRVITHEVSFQPFSAFFSDGQATAYPIPIPEDFELTAEQNARLDSYLEKRFHGQFSMAGIRFWPEMRGLDEAFLNKAASFRQIVPVFTNVIYDTSQVHANVIFPHMFAWLDQLLELIHTHPETLFVIRAHPDEMRPGTAKQSKETVQDWIHQNGVDRLSNVIFIEPSEYISSYELIQRSKFVFVYNSSIGLEAALMAKPVLCAGKARYTQYPIVFFPHTSEEYRQMAQDFLAAEAIAIPPEFQRNARRFLYYQLYRASLGFGEYLQDAPRKGFVTLKPFTWKELLPEKSPALRTIIRGITCPSPGGFLMDEE